MGKRLGIGSVVLVRLRVDRIATRDDFQPYCCEGPDGTETWFSEDQVVEVLEGASAAEAVERAARSSAKDAEDPERRLTVGDRVYHKWHFWWGEGVITKDDGTALPYHVKFPKLAGADGAAYEAGWIRPRDLIRAPEFEVGDRVVNIHKPEWGRGTVEEVIDLEARRYEMFDFYGGEDVEKRKAARAYRVRFDQMVKTEFGVSPDWITAEENLIRIKESSK